MTSLYDRLARTEDGSRHLAAARLRHEVLKLVHRAQRASGLNQVQLAKKLGVRKSAVNQVLRGDGNLRINTLAEYLHATGFEMTVELVPAGQPREHVLLRRTLLSLEPMGQHLAGAAVAPGGRENVLAAVMLAGTIPLYTDQRGTWSGAVGATTAASAAAQRAIYRPQLQPIVVGAPQ
ncbi:helix-turn-helix transcriptional regulator [Actinocrinis puniceicyclus]|uniref:Helix-turn-helix transcriptional regulator n=1 Tax=Actinocrinis puniceicyclus TaxID=977794 RepID=A0A8J7WPC2_9ACTN|nr:helix-turn-helix domain-containing protein [Actinocrinis puniceicyclus]MBS2963094.1 helix-turn-helix transcriptional regulator [Actinocrinis puniceicyclus]